MDEFCNFTSADVTIFTEYKHVLDMITSPRRQPSEKVLLQAGRLFVNFISILTRRYYYYGETEESDIKFAEIEIQVGVIIDKLKASRFFQQADEVKTVHEEFINLMELQRRERVIQNELLKQAFELAHARASERTATMKISFRNPVQSAKALTTWATENPWKCCAILVGGTCLVAVCLGKDASLIDMHKNSRANDVHVWHVVELLLHSL